ncbi:hypothetical protein GCM10017566_66470 [Amycolatopsis bartoniae]|uniref:Uncharacterized protein n=1 Tax=Amycolatopsis bartoniae TaxID=941986 RepID=A0A8H9J684_9PSEU|nr:hypothetical protein GCM10017566_66470 [Amycolatopsis bartoniae]
MRADSARKAYFLALALRSAKPERGARRTPRKGHHNAFVRRPRQRADRLSALNRGRPVKIWSFQRKYFDAHRADRNGKESVAREVPLAVRVRRSLSSPQMQRLSPRPNAPR